MVIPHQVLVVEAVEVPLLHAQLLRGAQGSLSKHLACQSQSHNSSTAQSAITAAAQKPLLYDDLVPGKRPKHKHKRHLTAP